MTLCSPEHTQSRKTSPIKKRHFQVHFLSGLQVYIGNQRDLLFEAKQAFAPIIEAPRQQTFPAALL